MSADAWVLVGLAGAAHGVRGELRLKSFTETPMGIADYPALWAGEPPRRRLEILAARLLKDDMLVVRFAGIEGRDAAQALTNAKLFVARADLPAIGEDEFYHADLVGLEVCELDGTPIGTVTALENFGAGDLLDVAPARGESFYVPFTKAFVPTIDLAAGRLFVAAEALAASEVAASEEPDGS